MFYIIKLFDEIYNVNDLNYQNKFKIKLKIPKLHSVVQKDNFKEADSDYILTKTSSNCKSIDQCMNLSTL